MERLYMHREVSKNQTKRCGQTELAENPNDKERLKNK